MLLFETKDIQSQLNKAKECFDDEGITYSGYSLLGRLRFQSFQEKEFLASAKVLKEYQDALNIISSIIYNPYITNRTEESIRKAELAGKISNADFLNTVHDPKLWKVRADGTPIPQEVYKEETTDTLINYENIFIGFLITYIERDIHQYLHFCQSFLPHLVNGSFREGGFSKDTLFETMHLCGTLLRRIIRLKASYFYRTVSKYTFDPKTLKLTNVLLKNHSYNYCLRFYRRSLAPMFDHEVQKCLDSYASLLILRAIRYAGYRYIDKDTYQKGNLTLKVRLLPGECLLSMNLGDLAGKEIRIIFDFLGRNTILPKDEDYYAFTYYSLEKRDAEGHVLSQDNGEELQLMNAFIQRLSSFIPANHEIYARYCPFCQKEGILFRNLEKQIYTCPHCHHTYLLFTENGEDLLWEL